MSTTIDELITGWTDAERATDAKAMHDLLADDAVVVGPVGFVLDKEAYVTRMTDLRYDHLELDEVDVHEHGDTAVVVGHLHTRGQAGEHPTFPDLRVSFTVVPEGGAPRIAGMQYSFIGLPGSS
jgi:ketosteroid isomerase-like protein